MKKVIITLFSLGLIAVCPTICHGSEQHPRLYVSDSDHSAIVEKINCNDWARAAFSKIKSKIEPYADRHTTDPEWIVSRLAMYWKEGEHYTQCYLKKQAFDYGEGNAPVPTMRMPGMRIWNSYRNVPLEQRIPYNETGDMLAFDSNHPELGAVVVPYRKTGHMVRSNNVEILTIAEQSAFIYWVTGEEKYARLADDVYCQWLAGTYYMNPILDPTRSCGSEGGWQPGGIAGYYDYEQIHDDLAMHAAVVYDFLYDYMNAHPSHRLATIKGSVKEISETVFRRFIDLGMIRGGKTGNWNVNGWDMVLRPVMLLDSDSCYESGKGREYYLNLLLKQETEWHDPIPEMIKSYDLQTGLWPESPGYGFSTVIMLLEWSSMLRRHGIDIVKDYPMLKKAALAALPWTDDRCNLVVFGDSRGGTINFSMYENLISSGYLDEREMSEICGILNNAIALKRYDRAAAGWTGICTYVDSLPSGASLKAEQKSSSYSPFHRFITLKNHPLMACLYGGRKGSHLSANGLALTLYGNGYALAPDAAAYESYWSDDNAYHQSATGSNTIMPGYEEGEITVNKIVDGEYADVSAGEKRRIVQLVKTGIDSGFYVDVFYSDQSDNDYIFHNLGTHIEVADEKGRSIEMTALDDIGKKYSKGYDFFKSLRAANYDKTFHATWEMPDNMRSRLWMIGGEGKREIITSLAPASNGTRGLSPANCGVKGSNTPTLIVRQSGINAAYVNGKPNPFIAVYESTDKDFKIKSVKRTKSKRGIAIIVALTDGRKFTLKYE